MASIFSFANNIRPKRAILFIRSENDERTALTPEFQEDVLREYCSRNNIEVLDIVRIACNSDESIQYLENLAPALPDEADSLIAIRSTQYSTNLSELSRICFYYHYLHKELFSIEYHHPIRCCLTCYNNPYE